MSLLFVFDLVSCALDVKILFVEVAFLVSELDKHEECNEF